MATTPAPSARGLRRLAVGLTGLAVLASASLLGCDIGRDQVHNVQPDPRASTAGIRPQTPAPVTDQPSKPAVAPPETATATPPAGG